MIVSPFSNHRVAKLRAALPKRSLGLAFSLLLATVLAVPAASKKDSDAEAQPFTRHLVWRSAYCAALIS